MCLTVTVQHARKGLALCWALRIRCREKSKPQVCPLSVLSRSVLSILNQWTIVLLHNLPHIFYVCANSCQSVLQLISLNRSGLFWSVAGIKKEREGTEKGAKLGCELYCENPSCQDILYTKTCTHAGHNTDCLPPLTCPVIGLTNRGLWSFK